MAAKKKVAKKKVAKRAVGFIAVSISRFGHDGIPVAVPRGSSVEDVLKKADIELSRREAVFIDGDDADLDDTVSDGDVVSIVSPKQAGTK